MDEWKAARKPIEQRLSGARKQLAKVSRSHVLDGYVGNGEGAAGRVGLARPEPAARDRRRRVDSVVVGPARRGYNRFDESRLTPVWRP